MRKSILAAVGLVMSLAGAAAAQQGERGQRPQRAEGDHREMGARRGRGGPDGLLLKGITLTDGQRAQIAQLNKTQRETMDARRGQRRAEMEGLRAARQRGDTAAVLAARQKVHQEMEQARTQRIAAIRAILTADQRVQFDRNVAEMQSRVAQRSAGDKQRPHRGKPRRGGR